MHIYLYSKTCIHTCLNCFHAFKKNEKDQEWGYHYQATLALRSKVPTISWTQMLNLCRHEEPGILLTHDDVIKIGSECLEQKGNVMRVVSTNNAFDAWCVWYKSTPELLYLLLGRAWASPTLASRTVDFSSAVCTSFRKCRLSSFNPKHCARRSVRAKNRKQCSPFTSATCTPTDRVKLPNQRGSKKTGDGAERDRTRRAAETADQRSERLRNWEWGTVPDALLKLLVKDKAGKVRERRETKPPRREERG